MGWWVQVGKIRSFALALRETEREGDREGGREGLALRYAVSDGRGLMDGLVGVTVQGRACVWKVSCACARWNVYVDQRAKKLDRGREGGREGLKD